MNNLNMLEQMREKMIECGVEPRRIVVNPQLLDEAKRDLNWWCEHHGVKLEVHDALAVSALVLAP